MVLTQAARGLIRGDAEASSSAEAEGDDGGRIAALLCFDEMQITDVFTAVALKGARIVLLGSIRRLCQLEQHSISIATYHIFPAVPTRCAQHALTDSGQGPTRSAAA